MNWINEEKSLFYNSNPASLYYQVYITSAAMNSMNDDSGEPQLQEPSQFQRLQPVDFSLTPQQYLIIQHFLPKRYSLIEHKHIKKGVVITSVVKLGPDDTQNLSRVSGNPDNTEDIEGRTKRISIKKVDKFLEEEPLKLRKGQQELTPEEEFSQCSFILAQLKKHKSSYPFLIPVDPKRDGVLNYFDIIKEPMDLQTVQNNLANGTYSSVGQFHAHVNKIWSNSYTYNERGTILHKLTVDMEKYYNNLLNSNAYKKSMKGDKGKARVDKEKRKQIPQQRFESRNNSVFEYKQQAEDDMI